jgi:DNA invertase Pin-like site-specific DNA recombinase
LPELVLKWANRKRTYCGCPDGLIACYCRVSTRHQKNDSQHAEIERWLHRNGIDPSAVRWFEDKESGTSTQRLAFDQMQKTIFEGVVKTVVVWKLDRISRRQRDGINLLADWCERGVRVVSVTQQIDLSGVVGRMVASVMFGLAEIELEYRRERQAAGIQVAKKAQREPPPPARRTERRIQGHSELVEQLSWLNAIDYHLGFGCVEHEA